jgi:hypothetical protein
MVQELRQVLVKTFELAWLVNFEYWSLGTWMAVVSAAT